MNLNLAASALKTHSVWVAGEPNVNGVRTILSLQLAPEVSLSAWPPPKPRVARQGSSLQIPVVSSVVRVLTARKERALVVLVQKGRYPPSVQQMWDSATSLRAKLGLP